MRRSLIWATAFLLALASSDLAAAQDSLRRFPIAGRPSSIPRITNPPPATPMTNPPAAQPPQQSPPPSQDAGAGSGRDHSPHGHSHHDHARHTNAHHRGYRGGRAPWFWGSPMFWDSGYVTTFFPYTSWNSTFYVIPSPSFVPMAPAPVVVDPAPVAPQRQPDEQQAADEPPRGKPRATNAEQKARAGKFIGYGDVNFAKQKFLPAVERYKKAAQVAPDLADAYLRQGFALVGLGQFSNAAKAFRRGLNVQSDWSASPLRLDQLYGGDQLVKTNHLESLATAAENNPHDADLLLVLGMYLYFDGQRERSGLFFARAAQLGGNEDGLLSGFLPKPAPGEANEPGNGKIVF